MLFRSESLRKRLLLPMVSLGVVTVALLLLGVHQLVDQGAEDHLINDVRNLQLAVDAAVEAGMTPSELQRFVSHVTEQEDVQAVVIVENGRVLAASYGEWIGQPIEQLSDRGLVELSSMLQPYQPPQWTWADGRRAILNGVR